MVAPLWKPLEELKNMMGIWGGGIRTPFLHLVLKSKSKQKNVWGWVISLLTFIAWQDKNWKTQ